MTWRHPSITYGTVEPEATSPPPGRRRAAGSPISSKGGALSTVENPIRTWSPYPSLANNKTPLRDGRVVDFVLVY